MFFSSWMELKYNVLMFSLNLNPYMYLTIKFCVINHLKLIREGSKILFKFLIIFGYSKIEMPQYCRGIEIKRL